MHARKREVGKGRGGLRHVLQVAFLHMMGSFWSVVRFSMCVDEMAFVLG